MIETETTVVAEEAATSGTSETAVSAALPVVVTVTGELDALAAFQRKAQKVIAEKRVAAEVAAKKAKENAAAAKAAESVPSAMPSVTQRPYQPREWIVPLVAVPTLQKVRDTLASVRDIADDAEGKALKSEMWDTIERELDKCPVARAEFHREPVVNFLEHFSGRFLPYEIVAKIMRMRVGKEVSSETAQKLMDAKKLFREHKAEVEGKPDHDPKTCQTCLGRPTDVFYVKRPTGSSRDPYESTQDFNFVIQRGGELEPYAKLIYGELKGWQTRSFEIHANLSALRKAFGVEEGKALEDVAAGTIPGTVVSCFVPRHLAVETTTRDGRSYSNWGPFFVYQMTEKDLAEEEGIKLPPGTAALQMVFPSGEEQSKLYTNASKMAYVAMGFGDVYSYSTVNHLSQPFYGLRAHHNGREYPAQRSGLNLRDVLLRSLRKEKGEEEAASAKAEEEPLPELPSAPLQVATAARPSFNTPRVIMYRRGEEQRGGGGRRHGGGPRPTDDKQRGGGNRQRWN